MDITLILHHLADLEHSKYTVHATHSFLCSPRNTYNTIDLHGLSKKEAINEVGKALRRGKFKL